MPDGFDRCADCGCIFLAHYDPPAKLACTCGRCAGWQATSKLPNFPNMSFSTYAIFTSVVNKPHIMNIEGGQSRRRDPREGPQVIIPTYP